ncbi:hypothetical protein [Commensalibacter oyaizuii]|uniref:Uncharacterized protein n=1 Tax=Commensalibacter oyaizuii TaxID=3043873 RepID=A0ABT6Q181_9PROT|nr:hypothetical protein [Commensalibacter sp. TBRC 16381]MDI2090876.1 hypothetical protein [Commensalibacter sp. TBRC 16381]
MTTTMTITGASGVVTLQGATGRAEGPVGTLQSKINNDINNGTAKAFQLNPDSGNPDVPAGVAAVGIIDDAGTYQIPSLYQYVVIADSAETGNITLNNNGLSANINILAGRQSGFTYNAGSESGQIMNTAGSLVFNGEGQSGRWTIYTGEGNSTVRGSNGNNQINTGVGQNLVTLGSGNNRVYSEGSDTITGGVGGYNALTLTGANSQVKLSENTLINDLGNHNTFDLGKNSTVTGGTNATVTFQEGPNNELLSGTAITVSAVNGADLKVTQGSDANISVDGNLNFFNGYGQTTLTSKGQVVAFGARGSFGESQSSYTLNAVGDKSALFVADAGNESLNASGSTASVQIYANTVSGGGTNFVGIGGSGDDVLTAGTGNTTFTGGAGNNLFMFTKDNSQNGSTVITDFVNEGSHNTIGLFNYGLDTNSLATLLQNSQNDAQGNAVLNIDGQHTITIQNVSVSQLNTDQFLVANNNSAA